MKTKFFNLATTIFFISNIGIADIQGPSHNSDYLVSDQEIAEYLTDNVDKSEIFRVYEDADSSPSLSIEEVFLNRYLFGQSLIIDLATESHSYEKEIWLRANNEWQRLPVVTSDNLDLVQKGAVYLGRDSRGKDRFLLILANHFVSSQNQYIIDLTQGGGRVHRLSFSIASEK